MAVDRYTEGHCGAHKGMRPDEYGLLDDFLYEAIFIRPGEAAPPRDIINRYELQVYVKDSGSGICDIALAAENGGKVVGAACVRIIDDYGHVYDDAPSLSVALYREYRGAERARRSCVPCSKRSRQIA